MGARREVLAVVAERYRATGRREKGRILDELCATTGWHRKHALRALSRSGSNALAEERAARQRGRKPQLTGLAIVGRLGERHPEQFCKKQHSIVQRLLKALRRKTAERLMAEMAPAAALLPGAVDGAACAGTPPRPQPLPSNKPRKLQEASDQMPPYLSRQGNIVR